MVTSGKYEHGIQEAEYVYMNRLNAWPMRSTDSYQCILPLKSLVPNMDQAFRWINQFCDIRWFHCVTISLKHVISKSFTSSERSLVTSADNIYLKHSQTFHNNIYHVLLLTANKFSMWSTALKMALKNSIKTNADYILNSIELLSS